ncbi:hypothetical protein L873DRAFT_1816767 [Choiromyces venosus 120613-1]|uniref:Uncharacterized protein n=1 Tax=Choiromyces venosus 120613-1 TaxID=1336337 RepID=A0A3N4J4F1_9PEZI|nr:hypothetical protein L873DRAFT_1816767 [Choiromyces venosus 120613-1]
MGRISEIKLHFSLRLLSLISLILNFAPNNNSVLLSSSPHPANHPPPFSTHGLWTQVYFFEALVVDIAVSCSQCLLYVSMERSTEVYRSKYRRI